MVGVEAVDGEGEKVIVKAKKVIIATGGFESNKEMLAKYVNDSSALGMFEPVWYRGPVTDGKNGDGRTGDGIQMAQLVGAGVKGMHTIAGNAPYLADLPPINQFMGADELKQGRCALAQPWLCFDLANSEHIDPERAKGNIYWDCFHGFRSALDPPDPNDLAATFSEVERQFYETHYTAFVEGQNERNAKIRHTERNRSIPDLLSSRKTCPEETIYQLGTLDEHASAEDLLSVVTEFIEKFEAKYGDHVHVLDWALHLDESTPHIHERHVFDCENKYGEVAPQQEKALEALGFDLPDPDKPLSRRNNRKITFDAACRKMLFEIAKRHGLELEEEAEYGNRKYLEKQDFILAKQKERLTAQQSKLDELTLKVNDMETLIDEVSAAAYDKAVEVVTDVVRTETRKEDMRMIEDTKKWVLSPERKAPQSMREYAAHRLDTVLDKFLKTMQTTATRLQEKLLKPEVRQKGKEQVKEKARDSVLQLLSRLQAEQAQNKPAAQPRTQEGHSEI